jgi:hypothetical protein
MSLISRFVAFYSKALDSHPLVTKSLTSGKIITYKVVRDILEIQMLGRDRIFQSNLVN